MPVSKEPKVSFFCLIINEFWFFFFFFFQNQLLNSRLQLNLRACVHTNHHYCTHFSLSTIFPSAGYINLHTSHSSSLFCLFLCCSLSKVRKNDKDHGPTPSSPLHSSSLHLHTHEKTVPSMPPLMAGTLFISPANLSSFSFRNRGMRGWEESAKSIKYVKEDGQRNGRIKRGSRGGNEEGQEVLGDGVETRLVSERMWGKEKGRSCRFACDGWLWALSFDLSEEDATFSM